MPDEWEPGPFTFIPEYTVVRSIMSLGAGRDPEPSVVMEFTGRWNHVHDEPPVRLVVMLPPEACAEIAANLGEVDVAAMADLRYYPNTRRTYRPGGPSR
jgi:hypothetical protein